MGTLWSMLVAAVWWLLGWVVWLLGLGWWLLANLLWLMLWFVLPLAVLAYAGMRVAEHLVGKAVVRAWLRQRTATWGGSLWRRLSRLLLALGALPARVLFWLVVYTLWHSVLNLFFTPRWKPWQRAWGRRWRQPAPSR